VAGDAEVGIVLGGSGQGEAIAANKVHGIRAALCHDELTARLARQHNDANVLSLGGRLVTETVATGIVQTFLTTPFEGGRHVPRLAQLRSIEQTHQLRLTDEDDLQQLLLRRLQVRQQADLLEDLRAEVLRLVDDQHGAPPAGMRLQQVTVDRVDQHFEARGPVGIRDPQLVAYRRQELDVGQPRIEDQRDVDVGRELIEEAAADRRLAGADLARQLDESSGGANAVQEVREGLAVAIAHVDVLRIGRDRERRVVQPEMRRIHRRGRYRFRDPAPLPASA
jgi:hypothetical protein